MRTIPVVVEFELLLTRFAVDWTSFFSASTIVAFFAINQQREKAPRLIIWCRFGRHFQSGYITHPCLH